MSPKTILFASTTLFAVALGVAARAETAADTENTIEEIVVTAEKREQSLQDVPVAISVFTGKNRDSLGVLSVSEMANFTPGLQYSTQLDRVSLRGVGRTTNAHSADPSVAVYSDGIYTNSTIEAAKTPLFLDRIEILRGPQATLYGRNAIAGAINLVSRRPTDTFYAEARATYANYNHFILEGAVSGPTAAPGVSFRLAANWEKQTKGWYDNVVPGQPDEGNVIDTNIVEGQLKAQFNEHFEGWMKLTIVQWRNGGGGAGSRNNWIPAPYATYQSGNGASSLEPGYGCGVRATNVINTSPVGCVNPASTDARKFASVVPFQIKLNPALFFASDWTWHGPGFDAKYMTGGAQYHYRANRPFDDAVAPITRFTLPGPAGGLTIYPQTVYHYEEIEEWWNHEFTLTSTGSGPLQWLAGVYAWNQHYQQPFAIYAPGQAQFAAPTGASCPRFSNRCPGNPQLLRAVDDPRFHIKNEAIYGQVDYTFAKTLTASVGLRYSRDTKTGSEQGRALCFGVFTCTPGLTPEQTGPLTPAVDVTQQLFVPSATPPAGVTQDFTFDPATGYARREYRGVWRSVTGNATLQWRPDRDTTAYVRYSRGYKPGGFRAGYDTLLTANPYSKSEHLDDVEIGLKKSFGRTFQMNLVAFHYDYKDAQVPLSIVDTSGAVTRSLSAFYNVPKVRSQGIEVETLWSPIPNLQILFNYSYLDAKIRDARGIVDASDPAALDPRATPIGSIADCRVRAATPVTTDNCPTDIFSAASGGGYQLGQDLKGNRMPNSPKHKIAANVEYTWMVGGASVTGSVSYIWRAAQYGSIFNRAYTRSPSWDQVDARLIYQPAGDHFTAILYVKNLFNDVGYDGGATAVRNAGFTGPGAGGTTAQEIPVVQGITSRYPISPPRTYGLELRYRFD